AEASKSQSQRRPFPTVREVILRSKASTRLHNAAINNTLLSEWTADQALAELDTFWDILLELPNVGRTTALELLDLLTAATDEKFILDDSRAAETGAEKTDCHYAIGTIDPSLLGL